MNAAYVRHELRTPLNAIIGYSEMILEESAGPPEASELLKRILATAASILSTIDCVYEQLKLSGETARSEGLGRLLSKIDADRETVAGCLAGLRAPNGLGGAFNDDLDAIEKACGKLDVLTAQLKPEKAVLDSPMDVATSA